MPASLPVRSLLATALAAPLAVGAVVTAAPAQAAMQPLAQEVITRVNAERAKVGCSPLRASEALRRAAQAHSYDMRTKNYFSHTSKDGRSPWDRIRATGYRYGSAENIAAGQRTAKAVVDSWMKSTGHRKNILNCGNKAIGVGVSQGSGDYSIYWTQDFGTR
ncbi:CAP domain-containing protein [Phycicoccus sp. MAQZ13P-2]|uniref:CAP domain-containing protein n=1 Tax=Phycicoccus mangrovi TaxID=2840470 RepID=UPI001C0088E6|nr:CAP domain-containing protein [Phycicoccus mangrovi]MBT9256839.1 CAP domain-containing protein [Phycicoccus mangrovi]MBT9275012.1 CAP domain-containing protein [Phycicoccus mangrovi]